MQKSKNAFTMIELIFVIVILGILAAVAIPKLAATRTDAKIAVELSNVAQVILNLGGEFTSHNAFINTTPALEAASLNCFTVTASAAQLVDGNFTVDVIAVAVPLCPAPTLAEVTVRATSSAILAAGGNQKEYSFGGIAVIE